jgi:hypothetical protein
MEMTLHKKIETTNEDGFPVFLWKFIDKNGNLWNTETVIEATEGEAKEIILQSLESE